MEFFIITTASDGVCARRAAHIVVVIVLLILRTWKMLVQRLKYTEAVKLLRDTRCNDCFTHKIGMRKCFTSTSVLYHLWGNQHCEVSAPKIKRGGVTCYIFPKGGLGTRPDVCMTVVTSEEVRKGGKLGRGGEGDHEATWKSGVFMLFTAYTTCQVSEH